MEPRLVAPIAIVDGSFRDWKTIRDSCDQIVQDESGIAVGILSRIINTDFGDFPMKFLLIFIDKKLNYSLNPVFRFTMKELMNEGLESILIRVGKKTLLNLRDKMGNTIRDSMNELTDK